ncbi:MAG: PRK06851 family protein [Syntrophomonadaceae bacterium]|nr:PRK06851 family protein [Syntrophomonadaceae bacterium]
MGKITHLFPGGNTCYGFYSLYDYMAYPETDYKIILKGGPGVGKSFFMKHMGEYFEREQFDLEYHWCSSDPDSLDGIVVGQQKVCILDGTAPHIVDPRFPGAVDEIINLGQFLDREKLRLVRQEIIKLSENVSWCFNKAYGRLKETSLAFQEWESYYSRAIDIPAVNRNILALAEDFLSNCTPTYKKPRHLFAGAITPAGIVTKVKSIIDSDYSLFAIQGSPGTGVKSLFDHILQISSLRGIYVEVFHNPFDPNYIDIILLPETRLALVNCSTTIVNYAEQLTSRKNKRFLDFNQFIEKASIEPYQKSITSAEERVKSGLLAAVSLIKTAHQYHDELESYYVDAMDFEALGQLRENLLETLKQKLDSPI